VREGGREGYAYLDDLHFASDGLGFQGDLQLG